jgi:hypothetical protein
MRHLRFLPGDCSGHMPRRVRRRGGGWGGRGGAPRSQTKHGAVVGRRERSFNVTSSQRRA